MSLSSTYHVPTQSTFAHMPKRSNVWTTPPGNLNYTNTTTPQSDAFLNQYFYKNLDCCPGPSPYSKNPVELAYFGVPDRSCGTDATKNATTFNPKTNRTEYNQAADAVASLDCRRASWQCDDKNLGNPFNASGQCPPLNDGWRPPSQPSGTAKPAPSQKSGPIALKHRNRVKTRAGSKPQPPKIFTTLQTITMNAKKFSGLRALGIR